MEHVRSRAALTSLVIVAAICSLAANPRVAPAQTPPKDIFGGFITKPNDMDKWHRGTVKEISDNKLVVADQKFKSGALVGKVICPNYDRPIDKDGLLFSDQYYRITANTEDTITTDPADGKLTDQAKAGDKYLLAGFFHFEKVGNHYVMVDPLDHPYLPMGVSLWVTNYFPAEGLKEKYGTVDNYVKATVEKMHAIGWNVTWEQGWPTWTGTKGQPGYRHPQMPHMKQCMGAVVDGVKPKEWGGRWESPLKNISDGLGHGSFVDVFDPQFSKTYGKDVNVGWGTSKQMKNDPWLIGYTVEEGDYTFGLLRPGFSLGWCAIAGKPEMSSGGAGGKVTYSDTKNYTKHEIAAWLKSKYGTIGKLNAAWGSKYTTFDSAGGYGKGTGVLDEDGKLGIAWLGKPIDGDHKKSWVGANANCKKDILAFQTIMVEKFYKDLCTGLKANSPDHILLGLCGNTEYAEDYWAEARWVDMTYNQPPDVILNMKDIGSNVIKPYCITAFMGADEDSEYANLYKGGKGYRYAGTAFKDQKARGQAYYDGFVNGFAKVSASGTRGCVGSIWWSWADMGNEKRNWGVVSLRDNMYDGKEATKLGADGKAGTWDDEPGDYGDCVTGIKKATAEVTRMFLEELAGKAPKAKPAPAVDNGKDIPDNPLMRDSDSATPPPSAAAPAPKAAASPTPAPATKPARTLSDSRGIEGLEISLILPGEKKQDAVLLDPKGINAKLQIANKSSAEIKVATVNKSAEVGDMAGQWIIGLFLEARNMDNTGAGLFRKADPMNVWLKVGEDAPSVTIKPGQSVTVDFTLDNVTDGKGNMILDTLKGQYLLQPSLMVYDETPGYWFGQAIGKQVLIRIGEAATQPATAPAK